MRFSLGPAMLGRKPTQDEEETTVPTHSAADEGTALLANRPPPAKFIDNIKSFPHKTYLTIKGIWNPPLTGAILAVLIGLIPPLKFEFYHQEGFFYGTITTSLTNIGELFTALMLFVLGAQLQLKTQGEARTPVHVLLYIYVMRFILLPVLGIAGVWLISNWGLLDDSAHAGLGGDPMMKFIMCLIPAGPPAIVLANIAELAGVAQGEVGMLLILSYVVSPTIAFTVAAALKVITSIS
jgi:auxin efflux carrier family protein